MRAGIEQEELETEGTKLRCQGFFYRFQCKHVDSGFDLRILSALVIVYTVFNIQG